MSLEETDQVRLKLEQSGNAWWKECEECGNRWVDKNVESHPEDLEIAVLRHTAIVLSRIAHSVGVQHHHHREFHAHASPGHPKGISTSFGFQICSITEATKGFETDPFYVRHPKMGRAISVEILKAVRFALGTSA